MFYKGGNTSSMWAGQQHENKENECVVCLRPVSLKALLCLNALRRRECVAALFVFNHRSRNERHKQTRCTMGAGRSSLPLSRRYLGRKPQGEASCAPVFIYHWYIDSIWLQRSLTHSQKWPRLNACMHIYTHIHSFLCLTLYFISFLISSHNQTESIRSQIFVFLHAAFWTFWPLMEISLPWKLFR